MLLSHTFKDVKYATIQNGVEEAELFFLSFFFPALNACIEKNHESLGSKVQKGKVINIVTLKNEFSFMKKQTDNIFYTSYRQRSST